ncbi:hypothetical protein BC831DRAFT_476954 [Entophlyctis helioformis]|nr:hypothetical protein BC831DRAFT_476954 [Entophlyctis helioformis]
MTSSMVQALLSLALLASATADALSPRVTSWVNRFNRGVPALPLNGPNGSPTPPIWTEDVVACRNPGTWGLTFDDGPSPHTPRLLDELKARNIKATFFVVGSRVVDNPDILKRTFDEGHQIAIHTWSHPKLTSVPTDLIISEFLYTARAIRQVIGVTPRFVRAPFGDIDPRVRAVARNMNLTVAAWTLDSEDARGSTTVAAQFQQRASQPHDLYETAVAQAPAAMDQIIAGGYAIARLDDCLGLRAYDESIWTGMPDVILQPNAAGVPFTTGSSPKPPPDFVASSAVGLWTSMCAVTAAMLASAAAIGYSRL